MKTTVDFLNAVKSKYDLKSNYALAKKMGQTDTDVARWMKGKNTLGDEAAICVADLLDMDPAYVVTCVHAERAKTERERNVWFNIAERMYAPALVLIGFCTLTLCNVTYVGDGLTYVGLIGMVSGSQNQDVYYVK